MIPDDEEEELDEVDVAVAAADSIPLKCFEITNSPPPADAEGERNIHHVAKLA